LLTADPGTMRYYGKILGAILGWMLLRHPIGAVIGGLIGHAFDAGWLGGGSSKPDAAPPAAKHYETLGLAPDASDSDVEQAYRRLMSQYHPDKVSGAAEEIRALAETRAQSINTAYEAILRERRRRE
jgi:DnaJ-domain-containing protein 1